MKNKILLINILNVVAIIIELIIVLIIALINQNEVFIYRELCVSLAIAGIIDFAFLLVKEIKFLNYDSLKFSPILNAIHTFLGVLLYYLVIYVDYANFKVMYWGLLIASIVLPIIIFGLLNYHISKKMAKNKPKVIVNHQRNYK